VARVHHLLLLNAGDNPVSGKGNSPAVLCITKQRPCPGFTGVNSALLPGQPAWLAEVGCWFSSHSKSQCACGASLLSHCQRSSCWSAPSATVTQVAVTYITRVQCAMPSSDETAYTEDQAKTLCSMHRCGAMQYVQVHLLIQGQKRHTCSAHWALLAATKTAAAAARPNDTCIRWTTAAQIYYTTTVLAQLPSC
jgi:hypothetical protein